MSRVGATRPFLTRSLFSKLVRRRTGIWRDIHPVQYQLTSDDPIRSNVLRKQPGTSDKQVYSKAVSLHKAEVEESFLVAPETSTWAKRDNTEQLLDLLLRL